MNGYLLDTHVWYWLLGALDVVLKPADRDLLETASKRRSLFLSAMSVWETAQKESSGRLQALPGIEALMARSFTDGSIQLVEASVEILIAANRLPGVVHGDPVDSILVATARVHDLTLVTHDTELRRYAKQGHLRVHKV